MILILQGIFLLYGREWNVMGRYFGGPPLRQNSVSACPSLPRFMTRNIDFLAFQESVAQLFQRAPQMTAIA